MAIAYPAAIALLFYFAFLRPVQQNQKRQREELANLRIGDEVLTTAGFIAIIKDIRVPEEHGPTEIILDLGGLEVRAVASAILQRLTSATEGVTPRTNEPVLGAGEGSEVEGASGMGNPRHA